MMSILKGFIIDIESLFVGSFKNFLNDLLSTLKTECIDIEHYNSLIDKYFSSDDVEFTASEVYNYHIYEKDDILQSDEIINVICQLINTDISFISLDPKRLSIMITKTRSTKAIKALLYQLFIRSRKWTFGIHMIPPLRYHI